MITVEIDTGVQIEKYEYIGEDIDTYIVSSDDIDLSKEGFILKQKESTNYTVESKYIFSSLPLRSVQYNVNIVEKKCKIVKQEDVIRCYGDRDISRSYFYGIECSYKEMDGFIRIEPFEEPQWLINEFTYEKYLFDRGSEYPPMEHSRYYKDISYDDVRFQRDVITKKHIDYIVNVHRITKEMNEEERKQLTIEYLIDKLYKNRGCEHETLSALLFGSYGYRIPDKLYATDLDSIFDKVLPRAYELISTRAQNEGKHFLSSLVYIIKSYHICNKDNAGFVSGTFWIEDGKIVYPSKDYAFFMKVQLQLKLMNKHKNQEYPYTLIHWLHLKDIYYYWRDCSHYAEYLTKHNPVYWNNKLVCDDLGDYVKNAMKELIYFKHVK